MAKTTDITIYAQKRFAGGIADYLKESANGQIADAFYFARAINYRDDPQALTLLPRAVKETGSTVTDLIKWAEVIPANQDSYYYGDTGHLYKRSSSGTWSDLYTMPNSHGNGLGYFAGDDYLYFTNDTTIGRYGPISGTPSITPDFLQAQGGIPQNTGSLVLASSSSQYATAADSASLSITGDLSIEAFFKATTLPSVGNRMSLVSKWDESGTLRSYTLDLFGISGYFGDGSDGALTISTNTTEAPIDSACTGTSGAQTLSATNASFAVGQVILIHQSQRTNAGQWERNTVQGYTAGTITLGTPLLGTYGTGAQVRVLKQYTNVTINNGIVYRAKDWDGTVGGILSFLANGTVTNNGTLAVNGSNGATTFSSSPWLTGTTTGGGFRGGRGKGGYSITYGGNGEGTAGPITETSTAANGNGGGSGYVYQNNQASGGGGGNGTAGNNGSGGTSMANTFRGSGGNTAGSTDLTTMVFGGGGGGRVDTNPSTRGGSGGSGGGIVFVSAVNFLTNNGYVDVNGGNGTAGDGGSMGGCGAGGSVLIKCQTATLGTNRITALGGTNPADGVTGNGGNGRVAIYYYTSYTGTSNPTLNAYQDNTLVTTSKVQARLGISSNGTNVEYLTKVLDTITTDTWNRLSVTWKASTSTATFYLNATSLGTSSGALTAIHNNTSLLYLAANKGASVVENFFNGKLDDVRIWNYVLTADEVYYNNVIELVGNEGGLQAYWTLDSTANDATSNANNLTLVNSPTYSTTDVPFLFVTTRLDIDQSATTGSNTYALQTAISETTANKLTFTPAKDPQSSIAFNISAKGTGNWTVTIHDQQNRIIATKTITNAQLASSGWQEFVFSTPWRPVLGRTYHAHLTSTVADGTVLSVSTNDLSTAQFYTYYNFLVTDTNYHPIIPFLNTMIIGNERYLATWDGAFYEPNAITFPPAWNVRCFGLWREFLAIGMARGNSITDFDKGRVYFWDGIAPTFNFFIDVPEGQINALFGIEANLFMFAGFRGQLLNYKGGYSYNTGNSSSNKVKKMPLLSNSDTTEVLPGALTMWRGLMHFGLYGNSNSTTAQRGVYSWGTYNQLYPDSLSYDYVISTGNYGNTVKIGCVYPLGTNLMIGWQDGISYGVDRVSFTNNPAPNGELQMLVNDTGSLWHTSAQFSARADYLPLQSGEGVQVKVKLARAPSFIEGTADTTANSTFSKVVTPTGRANEWQLGVNLTSTGSTSPTVISLALQQNALVAEERF